MKRVLALGLVLALPACTVTPWRGDADIPRAGAPVDPIGKANPWDQLEGFDRDLRDVAWNYVVNPKGIDRVRYPKTASLGAVAAYLGAGKGFRERGELGGASRAYWAALSLVRRTVASRPQRETVRRAAYGALAGIARQREQPRYAELLQLCADLAGVYLTSPQAGRDEASFFKAMDEMVERQQAMDEAARLAEVAAISQGVQLGASALGRIAEATTVRDPAARQATANEVSADTQRQARTIVEGAGQAATAYEAAIDKLGVGASKFKAVVADDVAEIEAGKSFVAVEAAMFLASAARVRPYLEIVRSFAKGAPRLSEAVRAYAEAVRSNAEGGRTNAEGGRTNAEGESGEAAAEAAEAAERALVEVTEALKELELEVARCERIGKPCAAAAPPSESGQEAPTTTTNPTSTAPKAEPKDGPRRAVDASRGSTSGTKRGKPGGEGEAAP